MEVSMKRWTKFSVAMTVVVVLLAGGAFALVASAQAPTPPAGSTPGDVFWATLAAKLNVSQDTLKSAVRDAAKAVVAEGVKAGKFNQEQADKLNQRIDKLPLNQVPLPMMPLQRGPSPQQKMQAERLKVMLDSAANTLGMSPSDLIKELRDGLTLGQIAQQKGVDPNKVRAAMLSVLTERIDQAVKNGKMTQDKANELTAKLEKQVDLNKRFQLPGKSPQDKPPKP
jgi:polyhydroxyalkanoate synthesis regulator phasin